MSRAMIPFAKGDDSQEGLNMMRDGSGRNGSGRNGSGRKGNFVENPMPTRLTKDDAEDEVRRTTAWDPTTTARFNVSILP